jgi:hypothetical protein
MVRIYNLSIIIPNKVRIYNLDIVYPKQITPYTYKSNEVEWALGCHVVGRIYILLGCSSNRGL